MLRGANIFKPVEFLLIRVFINSNSLPHWLPSPRASKNFRSTSRSSKPSKMRLSITLPLATLFLGLASACTPGEYSCGAGGKSCPRYLSFPVKDYERLIPNRKQGHRHAMRRGRHPGPHQHLRWWIDLQDCWRTGALCCLKRMIWKMGIFWADRRGRSGCRGDIWMCM